MGRGDDRGALVSLESRVAIWWGKRKLKGLEKEGRMGWLMKNKLKVGGLAALLVQGLRAFPDVPHVVIEVLTVAAAILGGSGALPSDAAAKEFGEAAK